MGLRWNIARAIAIAHVALLVFACPARADRSWREPWLAEHEVGALAEAMGLDEAQRLTLGDLQAAYAQQHERAAEKLEEFFNAYWRLEEQGRIGPREEKEYRRVWARFRAHAEALRERFVADVELMARPDQAAGFQSYERGRLREQCVSGCELTGGQVDPRAIVKELQLPEANSEALEAILVEHERALDDAVLQWKSAQEVASRGWSQQKTEEDRERWWYECRRRERAVWARIVRIHDQALRSIAESVSPEQREKVLEAAYKAAAPWLYDDVDQFDDVSQWLEREDMTQEQKDALAGVLERGRAGLHGFNVRMVDELRAWEPKAGPEDEWWDEDEENQGDDIGGPRPRPKTSGPMAVWNARSEYLGAFAREAGEVLTSEQREELGVETVPDGPLRLPRVDFDEP